MTPLQHPDIPRSPLKLLGRAAAALAAGGVFVALSWDSTPSSDESASLSVLNEPSKTAERQSIVTEDGASPQLEAKPPAAHRNDLWALDQLRQRSQPAPVDGLWSQVPTGDLDKCRGDIVQNDSLDLATTAVPHSRGPP